MPSRSGFGDVFGDSFFVMWLKLSRTKFSYIDYISHIFSQSKNPQFLLLPQKHHPSAFLIHPNVRLVQLAYFSWLKQLFT
jgi:hypothetical protein